MRKALYMLGLLEETDIDWLMREGTVEHIEPGTLLIEEGKCIDHLYILLDGQLTVQVGQGWSSSLATLRPGEIVGEISFVDSRPPTASVRASHDSYLLAVSQDSLARKLDLDPLFASRFYKAIARFLADRLRTSVGRLGYGNAEQDAGIDALDDESISDISLAMVRTDKLIKHLRNDYRARVSSH